MDLKILTVDGLQCEMTDMAATIVQRTLDKKDKELSDVQSALKKREDDAKVSAADAETALKKAGETKDAEIATLKKQLEDSQINPQKLDGMVRERSETIARARAVIGDRLVVEGKTDSEIRRQLVDVKMGDTAKGWNDDQVRASFATLTAGVETTKDPLRDGIRLGQPPTDARDKAYEDHEKWLTNAWRGASAQ